MKYGLVEIDWGYVGAKLATLSDTEQISFFKAFVKECQTWGTEYQIQMQLANINMALTEKEKETLSMIGYREELK